MTYLGMDVLDGTGHNMREVIASAFERFGALSVNPSGRKQWDDYGGQPYPSRSFLWFATGRPEIEALRVFLDARMGRLVPFWVPTWCSELPVAADSGPSISTITVVDVGYSTHLFPVPARKHIAIATGQGAFVPKKVLAVVNNGNGTETLTVDSVLGVQILAGITQISYLTLCRLHEDQTPIRWPTKETCEATIRFREIPMEVP